MNPRIGNTWRPRSGFPPVAKLPFAAEARVSLIMEKPRFKMPFRVLTFSANTLIHAGVRRLFENEAELVQVGEATSTSQALAAYSQLNPDLILIGRKLSAAGSLAIVTTLRAPGSRPFSRGRSYAS